MKLLKTDWVVMPCFNEKKHIVESIRSVHKYTKNLIVVDDGSGDSTFELASKHNKHTLRHVINLGKGSALKTGADFALKQGAKKIVFIDSDGQHEAKELPRFFSLLDKYHIVFGSRRLDKRMPPVFRIGNYLLNHYIWFLFGVLLRDTQSGYRGLRSSTYKKIRWQSKDYSVESEMIALVGKFHLSYKEIEISTIYNNKYKGTTIVDGLKIGLKMLLFKLRG